MIDTLPSVDLTVQQALGGGALQTSLKMMNGGKANIDKTARDFEAMFASQLIAPMFEGIEVNPLFGGGHGEEMMRGFLIQEYGKIAAASGQLGIASAIKAEMIRAQEVAEKGKPQGAHQEEGG